MKDVGIIGHLQIIRIWASFALEKDMNFFNEKHMKSIVEWMDDALKLLEETKRNIENLEELLAMMEGR